jgi:glycosyltransferase involved in cell wall biosynthesis
MLTVRAAIQRRDSRRAALVVAPSRRFAEHLVCDYSVSRDRIRVVPNPIDLERFTPAASRPAGQPFTLLFVSRISVRKGVEMVIDLSKRLVDLADEVRIELVGDRTMWSDYRPLLADLDPTVAVYRGPVDPVELPSLYHQADGVLQPSHYEPFALTVGEALAAGLPVVASDEVGAAEDVDSACSFIFPAGDVDAFERSVRRLVAALENGQRGELSRLARAEAERLFDRARVARLLAESLRDTAERTRVAA